MTRDKEKRVNDASIGVKKGRVRVTFAYLIGCGIIKERARNR